MILTTLNAVLDTEAPTAEEIASTVAENPGVIKEYLSELAPKALDFAVNLIAAVLILWIGMYIIKWIGKILRKSLNKSHLETGVVSFLCSLVRYVLIFILIMLVLAQFGVTTGSVVAVLGSAGLTVGLALQGSLSNFAGGVLILLLKPFVVGDYIVDQSCSQEGTVSEITICYTKLKTVDNRLILIPNGTLSNATIINVSKLPTRQLELNVGVSYQTDLSKAKAVLQQLAIKQELVLQEEPITVFVSELGDSAVILGLRVWVKSQDYWTLKWKLTEEIKNELDANGISIPYPQMDVSIKKTE